MRIVVHVGELPRFKLADVYIIKLISSVYSW